MEIPPRRITLRDDGKEKFIHLFIFREPLSQVEEILGSYAESSGFRKIELNKEQIGWLIGQMNPSKYEIGPLDSEKHKYVYWRIYKSCVDSKGYVSVFPCHRRGGVAEKNKIFKEELFRISKIMTTDFFYVWDQEYHDDDMEKGYQLYRSGELKKSIVIYSGGGPDLVEVDGKQVIPWPKEVREKIGKSPIQVHSLPLTAEFYRSFGFPSEVIEHANEVSERLQGGLKAPESGESAFVFIDKRFSDFESYSKFFRRTEKINQIIWYLEAAVLLGVVILLLRGCFGLFGLR